VSRRVLLFIATSLDGYIAGPGGSLDWLFTDDDYGYDTFIEGVDTLAMGRNTFETVLGFGEWPYSGLNTWVFSRRENPTLDPRARYTSAAPSEWLANVAREPGKNIWVVGGGELIQSFLDARLVDEMTISVHPIVLGGGTPLFPQGSRRHKLRLVQQRRYDSGLSQLVYVVQT
jgi:dihydrofolate reductase